MLQNLWNVIEAEEFCKQFEKLIQFNINKFFFSLKIGKEFEFDLA